MFTVLLGDGPGDERFLLYPTVRVADWGLSEITNRWDCRNSFKFKTCGTLCFMPPVSLRCILVVTGGFSLGAFKSIIADQL